MFNSLKLTVECHSLRSPAFLCLWLGLSISYLGDQFTERLPLPADDLPFVAPRAPVSRSGSGFLGSICADRSLAVAATHSADHARTGLRCASCSDNCGGTTRNIDGRAPSPIPLTCTGDWSFWHRMYSGGGRRIALSNDARPGREDEKRAQMSTRTEHSAF